MNGTYMYCNTQTNIKLNFYYQHINFELFITYINKSIVQDSEAMNKYCPWLTKNSIKRCQSFTFK